MIEKRAFILRTVASILLVYIANAMSIAQEKNVAYYSNHQTEIIGDAQKAFHDGDYERVLILCGWHYIMVGDGRADKLKQKAKSCRELYQSMVKLNTSGQLAAAREKAQALLTINPNDQNALKIYSAVQVGPSMGSEAWHTWVDLGLSVKWATCNVGATKPEEYGDYYAWGETEPKTDYNWLTYKFRVRGDSEENVKFHKYCTLKKYCGESGFPDNKMELELADDVARANWGDSWRMPTRSEWKELLDNCTWTWTNNYNGTGVVGMIVTSKKSGYTDNSIFLPAAGGRYGTSPYFAGYDGNYWSSFLFTDVPSNAYYVSFYSGGIYRAWVSDRYLGHSVRPVTK